MTQSAETQKQYTAIATRVRGQYLAHVEASDTTPESFASWLRNTLAPSVTANTWQRYRAAIVFCETDPNEREIVLSISSELAKRRPRSTDVLNTSAQRKQTFSKGVLHKVLDFLSKTNSETDAQYALILYATSITGLRPCEWPTAELSEISGEPVLIVENAKIKQSSFILRTLILSDLTSYDSTALKSCVDLVATKSNWPAYQEAMRKRMTNVFRRVLNPKKQTAATDKPQPKQQTKYPTWYTARHQFASNLKSSGVSLRVVSALLGHATTATTARFYGKHKWGNGKSSGTVRSLPSEVERVRDSYTNANLTAEHAHIISTLNPIIQTMDAPAPSTK